MRFLIIIMFIAYFAGGFQLFSISTYGVTTLDVATLMLYVVFFAKAFWNNYTFKIPVSALTISLLLFLISTLLSGLYLFIAVPSAEILQYFKTFTHLIFLMLFSFICLSYPLKVSVVDSILKTWLLLSIIINIFGVYQIFARAYDLPLAWLDYNNISMTMRGNADSEQAIHQLSIQFGNFFRATSIFSEPSALATFNIYIIVLTAIPYIQGMKQFFKSRALNLTIFILAIIGMFLSFSLTGVLGLLFVVGAVFIFESKRTKLKIIEIVLVFVVLLIPADILMEEYTDTSVLGLFDKRITGILTQHDRMSEGTDGESFSTRLSSVYKAIEIWEDSQIIGTGLGLTQYQKKVELNYSEFSIMTALCELGIVGALSFTAIFIAMFRVGVQGIQVIKSGITMDESLRRQFGLILYFTLIQIEINFITGNNLIVPNLLIPIIFILAPSYRLLLSNSPVLEFRILNQSIKSKWFSNKTINQ